LGSGGLAAAAANTAATARETALTRSFHQGSSNSPLRTFADLFSRLSFAARPAAQGFTRVGLATRSESAAVLDAFPLPQGHHHCRRLLEGDYPPLLHTHQVGRGAPLLRCHEARVRVNVGEDVLSPALRIGNYRRR
jgi:hypothetical protein